MKYTLSYTETPFKGYKYKQFKTKKDVKSWISKNKKKLYWHSLIENDAKSKLPRPIIKFDIPEDKYTKKIGTLMTHFETGMECTGLIFQEDGKSGYDGMVFIKKGHLLELDGFGRYGMLYDHDFAKRDGYRLSFYPQGFSRQFWVSLFLNQTKATIWIKRII